MTLRVQQVCANFCPNLSGLLEVKRWAYIAFRDDMFCFTQLASLGVRQLMMEQVRTEKSSLFKIQLHSAEMSAASRQGHCCPKTAPPLLSSPFASQPPLGNPRDLPPPPPPPHRNVSVFNSPTSPVPENERCASLRSCYRCHKTCFTLQKQKSK